MTKKATKTQEEQAQPQFKGRLTNTPSRTLQSSAQAVDSVRERGLAEDFTKQRYSSEEQALEVLVDSIVSKLADNPQDQAEMREFLDLVLETDPPLRQEILASTSIRK